MIFEYNDGGRADAGYKGKTNDCVCRAISIATGLPYSQIYDDLNQLGKVEKKRISGKRSSARTGVFRETYQGYLEELGWQWVPTMRVGQGCIIHMRSDELPAGTLIVKLSKHLVTVIDHVIHDTFDPSRNGTRCVYGYFIKAREHHELS